LKQSPRSRHQNGETEQITCWATRVMEWPLDLTVYQVFYVRFAWTDMHFV